MIYLSVKEKEKYVIELRKQDKTYKEIAHQLKISPREISKILKKATGKIEEKERKKIVLSKTAQALKLKKGKSLIDVVTKLDLSRQEANSLYTDYLYLNNLHHFVERFKEFDKDSLQDLIDNCDFIKENGITKEEIVEAIKKRNELIKIKEEHLNISEELKDLKKQREFYISDNKILKCKNCELNNEYTSLVSKNESANRMLQLKNNELNKERALLDNINNSKDYTILKNKVEEQINDFLNHKKEIFKLAAITILDLIKADPDKDIIINNILYPNENPEFGYFIISYEEKIAQIADTLHNTILEINRNNVIHS
jgi:transcriptional regulator